MSYDYYRNNVEKYQPSSYKVLFKPVTLPISLVEAKEHLKVDDTSSDAYISSLISSVTLFAEKYTKRDFITKKYLTYIDCFFEPITLRRNKVFEIISIKYLLDNVLTTVDSSIYYLTDEQNDFADILLTDGSSFPSSVDNRRQAVQIQFYSGFGVKIDSAILAGGTVTVTTVNDHYFTSGQKIVISGAIESNYNGTHTITVTGDKTFTYPLTATPTSPATGTLFANDIPQDLKTAMLQHISRVFENRGDCDAGNSEACDISSSINLPAETKQTYSMYRIWEIL